MVGQTTTSFLTCSYMPEGCPFLMGVPLSQHSKPERSLTHRKVQRRHSNGTWYILAELPVSIYIPGGCKGIAFGYQYLSNEPGHTCNLTYCAYIYLSSSTKGVVLTMITFRTRFLGDNFRLQCTPGFIYRSLGDAFQWITVGGLGARRVDKDRMLARVEEAKNTLWPRFSVPPKSATNNSTGDPSDPFFIIGVDRTRLWHPVYWPPHPMERCDLLFYL